MTRIIDAKVLERCLLELQDNENSEIKNKTISVFLIKVSYRKKGKGGLENLKPFLLNSENFDLIENKKVRFSSEYFKKIQDRGKVKDQKPRKSYAKRWKKSNKKKNRARHHSTGLLHEKRKLGKRTDTKEQDLAFDQLMGRPVLKWGERSENNRNDSEEESAPPLDTTTTNTLSTAPITQSDQINIESQRYLKIIQDKDVEILSLKSQLEEMKEKQVEQKQKHDFPLLQNGELKGQMSTFLQQQANQKQKFDLISKQNEELKAQMNTYQQQQAEKQKLDLVLSQNGKLRNQLNSLSQSVRIEQEKSLNLQKKVVDLENLNIKKDEISKLGQRVANIRVEKTKNYYESILRKIGRNRLKIFRIEPDQVKITGKRLGEGSFGIVKEGQLKINRDVAVKEIQMIPGSASQDRNAVIKEFEAQVSLAHPNILQVYGYSEPRGRENVIQIIMEKMDMNLFEYIQKEKPLMGKKIDLMQKMAKSVYYLHHQKPSALVHRDIKSANFLVSSDGQELKMCDFGLLKALSCSQTFIQSKFQGSFLWLAPEIFQESPEYSIYSDVYALGITFWEIMFERMPFDHIMHECQGNPQIFLMHKVRKGVRPEINGRGSERLPEIFKKLLRLMWCKDPRKRLKTDDLRGVFGPDAVKKWKSSFGSLRFP